MGVFVALSVGPRIGRSASTFPGDASPLRSLSEQTERAPNSLLLGTPKRSPGLVKRKRHQRDRRHGALPHHALVPRVVFGCVSSLLPPPAAMPTLFELDNEHSFAATPSSSP